MIQDEKEEYDLISYAKSQNSESFITIQKKKKGKKKDLEIYLNSNVSELTNLELNYVDDIENAFKSELILSLVAYEEINEEKIWNKNAQSYERVNTHT
jgi:hypothetical protein